MLNQLFPGTIAKQERYLFIGFVLFSLIAVFLGIALDFYLLFGLPFAFILGFMAITDFQKLFFLLLALLPFSIEIYLPNGFGIDLPAEPLMIFLSAVTVLYLFGSKKIEGINFIRHPISILLLLHLSWILIAALNAEQMLIGLKFFAAKLWFILPFFVLPILLAHRKRFYENIFWILLIILLICMIYVNFRHALTGFSFAEINASVSPFFRNHVNYASVLVIFLPFIWAMYHRYKRNISVKNLLAFVFLFFLISIYFTYTRAAQGAVLIAIGAYFLVRYKLIRYSLMIAVIGAVFVTYSLLHKNQYIYMAPDFEKTVSHDHFDNLIEATINMEDISTMERFHRWVAGYNMILEKPVMGFGPGNFYPSYQPYTVYSFETYVSDNPDRSGIHNYYLMTLVEQGFIGLIILGLLLAIILLRGESLYHRIADPDKKRIVMASMMSIVVILSIMLVNDLLESLKVGSMFFLFVSFIVIEELRLKNQLD
jgi:O-antigen ligase